MSTIDKATLDEWERDAEEAAGSPDVRNVYPAHRILALLAALRDEQQAREQAEADRDMNLRGLAEFAAQLTGQRLRAEQAEREQDDLDRRLMDALSALADSDEAQEEAERTLSDLRAAVKALRDQYDAQARDEGYGGELWSTTASALDRVLRETDADNGGGEGQ